MFSKKYQQNIGDPTANDEVRGHMIFAVGLLAGLVGMALFLFSASATATREAAIVASAAGVSLMVAGPIVRLPLKRMASILVTVGLVACTAAIVWFMMVFPLSWSTATGHQSIIALYGAGITTMALGGIFVPLMTSRPQAGDGMEAQRKTKEAQEETRKAKKEKKQAEEQADNARQTAAAAAQKRRDQRAKSERDEAATDSKRDEAERARLQAALVGAREDEADLAAELAALRTSHSRFEVFQDGNGDGNWNWRLRHADGAVLADDGGADYARRHEAQQGVARVRREALGATLLHLRAEEATTETETAFEPATSPEASSDAAFELYEGSSGNWRWRLRHENGKILADGGESFASKANVRRAVLSVQENAGPGDTLEFDPTGFQIYQDKAGNWRWRLIHRNGNILADGGQGYTRRASAKRAVDRIQDDPSSLDVEVYEDKAGEYRWRMTANNNRIVADGGQGYDSKSNARRAVDGLGKHVDDADTLEIGLAAFEIFEHDGGGHQWRLRHRNGNILARGADEGFGTRPEAREGIASVKRHASGAEIEED